MIRVELPAGLRNLAGVGREVQVSVDAPATFEAMINRLEESFPPLRGTIREYGSMERRAYLRFFAGGEDVSQMGMGAMLPDAVVRGDEALLIVGAVSGG